MLNFFLLCLHNIYCISEISSPLGAVWCCGSGDGILSDYATVLRKINENETKQAKMSAYCYKKCCMAKTTKKIAN